MNRPISTRTHGMIDYTWAMKAHLAMGFAMGTALLMSPLYLPRSERRYALIPMLLGAAGLLTAMMTQTESPEEILGFRPSRELSEAVADPDLARTSDVGAYLE
jgi:hypothetical protein